MEMYIVSLSKRVNEIEQARRKLLQYEPIRISVHGLQIETNEDYENQIRDIVLKMTGEQLAEATAALKAAVEEL